MAVTVNNMSDSAGVVNYATGQLTTDAGAAAALVLQLGFLPRYFRLVQITGGTPYTMWEWLEGMGAVTITTAPSNGAKSNVANGITVGAANTAAERSVTLAAGLLAVSSTLVWEAQG